jgi:hypothetical protein
LVTARTHTLDLLDYCLLMLWYLLMLW